MPGFDRIESKFTMYLFWHVRGQPFLFTLRR